MRLRKIFILLFFPFMALNMELAKNEQILTYEIGTIYNKTNISVSFLINTFKDGAELESEAEFNLVPHSISPIHSKISDLKNIDFDFIELQRRYRMRFKIVKWQNEIELLIKTHKPDYIYEQNYYQIKKNGIFSFDMTIEKLYDPPSLKPVFYSLAEPNENPLFEWIKTKPFTYLHYLPHDLIALLHQFCKKKEWYRITFANHWDSIYKFHLTPTKNDIIY